MDATALSILSNPTSSLLGETVRRALPVASSKKLSFRRKNSSTRAYATNRGGSPSLRKSVLGRAFNENEFGTHTSDSKYSRRDRLIALFKRIQVDISQGESGSGYYSKSSQASTKDDSSVETSVLEFLQQSYRETKVKSSKKHSEEANHKRSATNEEKSISNPDPPSTKFTRPPSNFVKKSPIPLTTQLLRYEFEVNSREESSLEADKLTSKINGLKLSELKQLAKSWGIKGYSKRKKSELVVELLKSRENV